MGCHSWESGTSVRNVRKAPHVYEGCSKEGLPVIRAIVCQRVSTPDFLTAEQEIDSDLFVAKSDHGIDLGGAACGDIAGNHRDQCEQEGNDPKC